jgi:hypothetical protein
MASMGEGESGRILAVKDRRLASVEPPSTPAALGPRPMAATPTWRAWTLRT